MVSSFDDDLEISPVPTPPVSSAPVAVSKISGIDPDTGVSGSDFITSSAAIVIKGEVSGVLGAGEVVQVRIDGGAWQDVIVTGSDWSYDYSGTSLSEGHT